MGTVTERESPAPLNVVSPTSFKEDDISDDDMPFVKKRNA